MTEPGRITEVSEVLLGTTLAADISSGVTSITVRDYADFNDDGTGTLRLVNPTTEVEEVIAYTSGNDDTGVITLAAATTQAYSDDMPVYVYPDAYEKKAQVVLDGEDDSMPCRIPHGLLSLIPEGIRDPEAQESVSVAQDKAGDWWVREVHGKPPVMTGGFYDPDEPAVPVTPPAVSPTLTAFGLTNSVLLFADLTMVQPGTLIAYHASFTDGFTPGPTTLLPGTPTPVLTYTAKVMPDGSPIPMDTVVYFRAVASNAAGAAAAGTQVSGQLDLSGVSEVTTAIVRAGETFSGRYTALGGGYWDAIEGIVLPQPGGKTTRFTVDGVTPSEIAGYALLDGATVDDNLNVYGLAQFMGTLKLPDGTPDPLAKATLSYGWDHVQGQSSGGDLYGLTDTVAGTEWVAPFSFGALFMYTITKTTGAGFTWTVTGNAAKTDNFQPSGGVVRIGSSYYLLGQDYARFGAPWFVYVLDSTFAWTAEFSVGTADQFPNRPGLGTDGTDLLVGYVDSSPAKNMRVRTYTTGGSLSSNVVYPISGVAMDVGGVYSGSADFGAARVVVATRTDGIFVFNTTPTRVTSHEWKPAGNVNIRGMSWDGTRFRSLDPNTRVWDYATGHVSSSTEYGGYTWYDADTSSGSSVHETKVSPAASFTWPARTRVIITGKPAPDVANTDAAQRDKANLLRVWLGTSAGAMKLQAGGHTNDALPLGVTMLSVENPATATATAPTSSTFTGIVGAVGKLASGKLDGSSNPVTDIRGDGYFRAMKYQQAGQAATGTMVANTDKTVSVTFAVPFDTANLSISLQVRFGNTAPGFALVVDNVATTGFDIIAKRTTGTGTFNVDWIATVRTQ